MLDEQHNPKKAPMLGKRTLGALEYRSGTQKANAMQSQSGGKRYNLNVTKKLAEEDTQKALSKANNMKATGKTATGQTPDPIELEPEKNIQGQGIR